VWMVATPLRSASRGRWLRTAARWSPPLAAGAVMGTRAALTHWLAGQDPYGRFIGEAYGSVTTLIELPLTVMLYLLLSRIAADAGHARLATQFRVLIVAIALLIGSTVPAVFASRLQMQSRSDVRALTLTAVYGAAALGSAIWGAAAVLRLAAVVSFGNSAAIHGNAPAESTGPN
jgi:hypothetical protein